MNQIKIAVAGPRGRMGREAVQMVIAADHFELSAVIDNKNDGKMLGEIEGFRGLEVPVYENIGQCFEEVTPDVLIDLTTPEIGMYHTKTALQYGVRPVVGTSGFSKDDLALSLRSCVKKKN